MVSWSIFNAVVLELLSMAFADAFIANCRTAVDEDERQGRPLLTHVLYEFHGRIPRSVECVHNIFMIFVQYQDVACPPARPPMLHFPIVAGVRVVQFQDVVRHGNQAVKVQQRGWFVFSEFVPGLCPRACLLNASSSFTGPDTRNSLLHQFGILNLLSI